LGPPSWVAHSPGLGYSCKRVVAGAKTARPCPLEADARLARPHRAHLHPHNQIEAAVDAPMLQGLIEGTHKLPHSDLVPTPKPVGWAWQLVGLGLCIAPARVMHHCMALVALHGLGLAPGAIRARVLIDSGLLAWDVAAAER
jgi:hypothetical protein